MAEPVTKIFFVTITIPRPVTLCDSFLKVIFLGLAVFRWVPLIAMKFSERRLLLKNKKKKNKRNRRFFWFVTWLNEIQKNTSIAYYIILSLFYSVWFEKNASICYLNWRVTRQKTINPVANLKFILSLPWKFHSKNDGSHATYCRNFTIQMSNFYKMEWNKSILSSNSWNENSSIVHDLSGTGGFLNCELI